MRKLRWLEQSVQKMTIAEGTVCRRLVRDFVLGVYLAGTTILSGVARALPPRPLFQTGRSFAFSRSTD